MMIIMGVSPLLALSLGSYLTASYEWSAIFMVLACTGTFLALAVWMFLPDSYQLDPTYSLKPLSILRTYLQVFVQPPFDTYALSGSLAYACLFICIAASPGVFMQEYHFTSPSFSVLFALLSMGFIGSSQLNTLLTPKWISKLIIKATLVCLVATSFSFLIGVMSGWYGFGSTVTLLLIILCCLGISSPITYALALAPFSPNRGTASVLLGIIQMTIGSLFSLRVTLTNRHSLAMAFATFSLGNHTAEKRAMSTNLNRF